MFNKKPSVFLRRPDLKLRMLRAILSGVLVLLLLVPPNSPISLSKLHVVTLAQSNPSPPCDVNVYGSPADAAAIQTAMLSGTEADVKTATNNAKETRGNQVGCQETCVAYTTSNFTVPTLSDIEAKWNSIHAPGIANYANTCPMVGRAWGPRALGGYYARQAAYAADLTKLANIADMYEAQQYKTTNAPAPLAAAAGVFGYLHTTTTDPCYPLPISSGGVDLCGNPVSPGTDPIQALCDLKPSICVTYNAGTFAERNFLIADIVPEQSLYDGGMAYDQGWAGVMMVEAKIQQPSQTLKNKFGDSAKLAGDWAIAEPPVRNYNYTAKLVWLLAQLYGWTGDVKYKTALMDKFNRNLKLGVLMDTNSDGKVDGMINQPFSDLTVVAQTPGRMWDGHNSRPTYHPMNAWAFVEAYVALRDRGNNTEAQLVKPYTVAMLNNLASEINNLGIPNSGTTQIPYALMLGLWKIAAYENEPHTDWEQAAWALWNSGIGNSFGDNTANVGLYLVYKAGVPYVPLKKRKEIYQPTSYSILAGTAGGGNLSSLYNNDNDYLVIGNSAYPKISVDFQVTQTEFTKLRISVTTKDSLTGIARKLYIWNKTLNKWELLGADTIGTTETTGTITGTSGLDKYVNNGVVKIGIEQDGSASHTMFIEKMELGVNE